MLTPLQPSQAKYDAILAAWPKDPLRPASVSVQTAIRNHLSPYISTEPSTNASVPTSEWNEAHELGQANALQRLVDNKYQTKYPVPESIRRPASQPSYYDDLLRELDEAPKRSWLGSMVNSWKGFLRVR